MENSSAVDLGLSVKWCFCNVGANLPQEPGKFWTWDELKCIQSKNWFVPSKYDFEELIAKCQWVWTNEYGRNGYKVIGVNGNSIFLPACGQCCGRISDTNAFYGYYWSADVIDSHTAWGLGFVPKDWGQPAVRDYNRINGKSLRMVCS